MNILQEANELTSNDRREEYGSVEQSFFEIATVASIFCNKDITDRDIAKIQIATKLVRESHKHKRDNLVDLAGYTKLLSILENDKND